ncbi:MAG: C25 family cysteine peptidase [Cytophagaceae bacterium]
MRKVLFFLLLLYFPLLLLGQVSGNEWIVPGQSYYKIPVANTGIHFISFTRLSEAGVSLSNTNGLKLYHRGVEQAIRVTGDGLVFFGKRNDGTLDSLLYAPTSAQPHKYYNLYSDTAAYFLTLSSTPGKRMTTLGTPQGGTTETYHMQELLHMNTNDYAPGQIYASYNTLSTFDQGEGWTGSIISRGAGAASVLHPIELQTEHYANVGVNPKVEVVLLGRNTHFHNIDLLFGVSGGPTFTYNVPSFSGYNNMRATTEIPSNVIDGSGKLTLTVRLNSGPAAEAISISSVKLTYPQSFNIGGRTSQFINLIPRGSDISHLELNNLPSSPVLYDITDVNNASIISSTLDGGILRASVSGTSISRKLFIHSDQALRVVNTIRQVDMNSYRVGSNPLMQSANYIILSHSFFSSAVNEYASYRASSAGGSYSVLVADVDKIYDQFAYGEKTPVAIHRFCRYLFANGEPKFLFVVGKGLSLNFNGGTASGWKYYRHDPAAFINNTVTGMRAQDFIPPAGLPGTDNLYTMGLDNSLPGHTLAIPVGRLPARSLKEVRDYLEKVKDHESLDSKQLWRKHFVHLSGGTFESEQNLFRNYVDVLKNIAEDTLMGGRIIGTYSKKTTGTIDDSFRESFARLINRGVSYMTFFGHSSPQITEIDIGYASNPVYGYNNYKKYPMIVMNGCNSGNPYAPESITEDWIIAPRKGAILVLGHTDYGRTNTLFSYSQSFYRTAFTNREFFSKSVGEIQKEVVKNYSYSGFANQTQVQQMVLQGDPAVKIYAPEHPDFHISSDAVSIRSFDGQPVTAVSDSFQVAMVINNFGRYYRDSIDVAITRTINGVSTNLGTIRIPAIAYQDTIYFTVRSRDQQTFGLNSFEVSIDPFNEIEELDKMNNTVSISYFMPLTGVVALFPKEYSVVSSQPVTLIAQSTDLMIDKKDYFIEIDTSYKFNSAFRKQTIMSSGSLVRWEVSNLLPDVASNDSTVYYWRARFNDVPSGQDTLWANSSFIYIKESLSGWSQSEFPQLFKAGLENLLLNKTHRRLDFTEVSTGIKVRATGESYVGSQFNGSIYNTELSINDRALVFFNFLLRGGCAGNSMLAVGFNRSTSLPYPPSTEVGACGHNRYESDVRTISALTNSAQIENVLTNMPVYDYILLVNYGHVDYSSWSANVKNILKNQFGSIYVDSCVAGGAYIFLGQKMPPGTPEGQMNPIYEQYAPAGGVLVTDTLITGRNNNGIVTSTIIGPSSGWGNMYKSIKTDNASDKWEIAIVGMNLQQKNLTELYRGIPQDSMDLSFINPDLYPYIKLKAYISDSVNLTPPQIDKWQVIYNGVPEGTLNPFEAGLSQYTIADKMEGDSVKLKFLFENISDLDFKKPVKVVYTLRSDNNTTYSDTVNLGELKAWGKLDFSHYIRTKGGGNSFQVYVNPRLQPEEYYNNNLMNLNFKTHKDETDPVLDVVFDGVHIMDGDIVSPSPMITISVNDENKFMLKKDTGDMRVFIKYPCEGCDFRQIFFSDPEVLSWGQTSGKKNSFRIEYNPKNLPDGMYSLRIQSASDASGNSAGQPYESRFQVINESAITNIYPYPNPFSSSTRFVFTLTGSEVPTDMKIQIMTVTGRVVREIMKEELGPIRIGNNRTEFAWDGTDEFGDKLANGVYLYRVIIKDRGDMKHRETAGDKAFKKGYGKLYILR